MMWPAIHHRAGEGASGRRKWHFLLLSRRDGGHGASLLLSAVATGGLTTTGARSTPVGDRGLGRLHAGDAAHPASGMRRAARVVQAGDRGAVVGVAGGGAQVEQLLEGELAVEDVAADQAVVVLHVEGADDVAVQDRGLEVRLDLVVGI